MPLAGLLVVVGLIVMLMAVVVVIVVRVSGGGDDESRLHKPLSIQPVTATASGPCAGGAGVSAKDGSTCYQVTTGMTVTQVKEIKTVPPSGGSTTWQLLISLLPDDAKKFGSLTQQAAAQEAPRNQLALIVDGKVISAPEVSAAIPGGEVQISGPFQTRAQVEELLREITGTGG